MERRTRAMTKMLAFAAALVALAVAAPAQAATVPVTITRAGFVPNPVDIKVGDTVLWTNADTQDHQVVGTQSPEQFASPVLKPSETFAHTFREAGRFRYEDPLVRRPRLRGTVRVEAPAASLTLAASPRTATYGRATTLSGRLSTGASGEKVSLFAQACGTTFVHVAETETTAGGAFTFGHRPTNNTAYQARWKSTSGATMTVSVRPRVSLAKIGPRKFRVRVFAASSFADKLAVVQRFDRTRRVWVRVRLVTLRAAGTGTQPTVVSGVTFRARVSARTRVRILLRQAQVGSCYVASRSNVVTV
jgi:plastocyanin